MHCMVSWGSTKPGVSLTLDEHKFFKEVLSGHSWVEVFAGTFVVALIYDEERQEIIDGLADVAKKLTVQRPDDTKIYVLVSPPIPKGQGIYSGWAAKNTWEELNKRSLQ